MTLPVVYRPEEVAQQLRTYCKLCDLARRKASLL